MNAPVRAPCLAACSALLLAASTSAFEYAAYRPARLSVVARMDIPESPEPGKAVLVIDSAASISYRVRAVYTGRLRPLPAARRSFLKEWAVARRDVLPPGFIKLYEQEVEFGEGKRRYWLPIQGPLVGSLRSEAKPGRTVTLYVARAGAVGGEVVLLINEFDAGR